MPEAAVDAITAAEAIGNFSPIGEEDMFDCEYWSLEQAKLGSAKELPLAGQIAVITGAAGAIGLATARAFATAGAEVALLDLDGKAAKDKARSIGGTAIGLSCDVTDDASVAAAFDKVAETFGGVDIAGVECRRCLAGPHRRGRRCDVAKKLRAEFLLASARRAQCRADHAGTGHRRMPALQRIETGDQSRTGFGPYGLPKAATLFLARQYALDYGADGIRSNAVNADRIRSGLLTDDFIKERSNARGLSEKDYMSGNLLQREVTADDVAQAFLHQALALKTTADVTTVDGGNIAAALR